MKKIDFIKELASRAETDFETAERIYEAHEDLIMEIIANEDKSPVFAWGMISGYTEEPKRLAGYYRALPQVQDRKGWTFAKRGRPNCAFTTAARYFTPIDPKVFFTEDEEGKFLTKAKQYREEFGLPEPAELDGLSEEAKNNVYAKADKEWEDKKKNQTRIYKKSPLELKCDKRKKKARKKDRLESKEKIIEEYLQSQRDRGIPEDQLVHKSYEEIMQEKDELWIANRPLRMQREYEERMKKEAERKKLLEEAEKEKERMAKYFGIG